MAMGKMYKVAPVAKPSVVKSLAIVPSRNRRVKRGRKSKSLAKRYSKLSGGIFTFPETLKTKFRYVSVATLTPGAGTSAVQTYRLNSLYDPDYTGGGLQPRYYDSLVGATNGNAPYAKYRVIGAKVDVWFTSNTASTSSMYVAIRAYSDSVGGLSTASSLTPATLGEVPNTKWKILQCFNGASSIVKLSMYVSMANILDVKDIRDDENSIAGYNANPNRQVYLDLYGSAVDGASTPSAICNVKITHYAECLNLNTPTYS